MSSDAFGYFGQCGAPPETARKCTDMLDTSRDSPELSEIDWSSSRTVFTCSEMFCTLVVVP
eukprot:494412-Alexandrium_andersonii.AAC.1